MPQLATKFLNYSYNASGVTNDHELGPDRSRSVHRLACGAPVGISEVRHVLLSLLGAAVHMPRCTSSWPQV